MGRKGGKDWKGGKGGKGWMGRKDGIAPRYVNPRALAPPKGYSNGVSYRGEGSMLFLAGQLGWDAAGRIVSERFEDQFDQALANLIAVVSEAGGRPESIGKLTIFVVDRAEYVAARKTIGDRYRDRMGAHDADALHPRRADQTL